MKKKKNRLTYNNKYLYFFWYPNYIQVNLLMRVCPRRNYHLFLILPHWSYFKGNDLFHTLNVYKIICKRTSGSW